MFKIKKRKRRKHKEYLHNNVVGKDFLVCKK